MGLDDFLIKKYAKKYLRNTLKNILRKPKKPLVTRKQIANYLAEEAETIYENLVLKKKK